jgi:phage-related protein
MGIGSAVFEIAIQFSKNAYRSVYAANIGDKIYILHAFQKKSAKGIKTSKKDVRLIRQRYQFAQSLEKGK